MTKEDEKLINEVLGEHLYDNIIIDDESGEEVECEIIGTVPYNDNIYIIVRPVDAADLKDDEAFGLKMVVEDGEVKIDSEIDDETLNTVFDLFNNYEEEEDEE